MTATAAAVVTAAAETAATAVALFLHGKSNNSLTAAFLADGAAGDVAASATTTALQRLRHQHQAELPAAVNTCRCWNHTVAAGPASPSLFSSSSLPLSSLALSLLHQLLIHIPHDLRLKPVLFVAKSKCLRKCRHSPRPKRNDDRIHCIRRLQFCLCEPDMFLKLQYHYQDLGQLELFPCLLHAFLHASILVN